MQTELAHANRVATMGQLTASITHEIKQPIAATVINAAGRSALAGASAAQIWRMLGDRLNDIVTGRRSSGRRHRPDSRPYQEGAAAEESAWTSTRRSARCSSSPVAKR